MLFKACKHSYQESSFRMDGNELLLKTISRGLLFTVLVLVAAKALASYRDNLKAAEDYLDIGAHAQALEQLETALQDPKLKGRKREHAEADLQQVRSRVASEQFAMGRKLEQRGEQTGAVNAYRKAAEYAPNNAEYVAKYQQIGAATAQARQQSQAILQRSRDTNNWQEGMESLSSLAMRSSLPEARFALAQLKQDATAYYTLQSDGALRQNQYRAALDYIARAERFSQSAEVRNKKLARHHLLLSENAWKSGRFSTAYEEIQKSLSFEPNNKALLAYHDRMRGQWMGALYNEAVEAKSMGRLQLAKQKFTQLSRFEPDYLDVNDQLSQLKQTLVADYYERAESLMRRPNGEFAGQALAYYMVVAEQQGTQYADIYDKIATAKQNMRDELEYRVSLKVTNSSGEPGATGVVRDNILGSLSAGLKYVKVLEREALDDILREQGLGQAFFDESTAVQVKKIKGIEAGIYVDVVKLSVVESGRDRPEYGSVRYVSGTRYVPNPRYSRLQQEVANAQQEVIHTKAGHNKALAEQNRVLSQSQSSSSGSSDTMSALANFGSVLGSIGASSAYKTAQSNLDGLRSEMAGESPQVEEDIHSDWRYKIMNLELAGEVILSYKIVNFTTSEVGESQVANANQVLRDRYVPGDPGKGIDADSNDLPSEAVFKKQLLEAAMESLVAGLETQLGGRSRNYYQLAQRAAIDGNSPIATENYIRYLYSGADLTGSQAREASDFLYEELGIQLLRRKR